MQTPAAGRNDFPPRLKRHFAMLCVPTPTPAALAAMFGPIVRGRFDAAIVGPDLAALAASAVAATVDVWQRVRSRLLPTPAKPHYAFTLRDVARVVRGLLLADRQALVKGGEVVGDAATTASSSSSLPPSRRL